MPASPHCRTPCPGAGGFQRHRWMRVLIQSRCTCSVTLMLPVWALHLRRLDCRAGTVQLSSFGDFFTDAVALRCKPLNFPAEIRIRVALSHFMLVLLVHLEVNKPPDVLVGCVVLCISTSLGLASMKRDLAGETGVDRPLTVTRGTFFLFKSRVVRPNLRRLKVFQQTG